MKMIQIRIKNDTVRYIYDDKLLPLAELGQSETRRASYVEPSNSGWIADLSPVKGPKLGPFKRKDEALEAEVIWIYGEKIPVAKV